MIKIISRKPMTDKHKQALRRVGKDNVPYHRFTYYIGNLTFSTLSEIQQALNISRPEITRRIKNNKYHNWYKVRDLKEL